MVVSLTRLPEPVRADSRARQVYQILQQAIFQGSFQLRELHLVHSLNVSQATVREAIVHLEHAGLVVRLRNRKSEITRFSREEVRDRLSMRIVVEEMAAVCASQHMSEAEVAELAELSAVLSKTLDQLTTLLFAFLSVLAKTGMVDVRLSKSHDALVTAIASRDENAIRRAQHQRAAAFTRMRHSSTAASASVQNWNGDVQRKQCAPENEQPFIMSVRFKLSERDARLKTARAARTGSAAANAPK